MENIYTEMSMRVQQTPITTKIYKLGLNIKSSLQLPTHNLYRSVGKYIFSQQQQKRYVNNW